MESATVDINELAETIANWCNGDSGKINIDTTLSNNIEVTVSGEYQLDEYQEDDYFTGTGGWVCKNATVDISRINFYDSEGNELNIDISVMELQEKIEDELRY